MMRMAFDVIGTVGLLAVAAVFALFGYWYADTDLPSEVQPLSLTYNADTNSIEACYAIRRWRQCTFSIDRYLEVGADKSVVLVSSGTYKGRRATSEPVEICQNDDLPRSHLFSNGVSAQYSVRLSYSCNPVRQLWPVHRTINVGTFTFEEN